MECGDPRTLDATLLKNEADLSPEIMLRIINNKVKKAEEGEESKKRKKSNDLDDLNRNNGSQSDEKRIAAPAENSAITSKECDVTMGSCPFAQVLSFMYLITDFIIAHCFRISPNSFEKLLNSRNSHCKVTR